MKCCKEASTAVLVVTPIGIIVVRDPSKPRPLFWKLPGGHVESGEERRRAAAREVEEETGVKLDASQLKELASIHKGDHDLIFFTTTHTSLAGIHRRKNKGEEVQVVDAAEILQMNDFLPSHRKVISKLLAKLAMAS